MRRTFGWKTLAGHNEAKGGHYGPSGVGGKKKSKAEAKVYGGSSTLIGNLGRSVDEQHCQRHYV